MRTPSKSWNSFRLPRVLRVPRWVRDERGASAIEFAMVALPFFMFTLGLIGIGLYFFTMSSLAYGAEAAARQIRTGQAQKGAVTVSQFKNLVCLAAGSYINCNKLSVIIQSEDEWKNITPTSCVDSSGNRAASTGTVTDAVSTYTGAASKAVLITLCYTWDLAQTFPFLKLGTGSNGTGSAVVQATTAFRTEPYS
jgi:Flp pilus assembly protein TadG